MMITYQHNWLRTKEDAQVDLMDLFLTNKEGQGEYVKVRSSLGCRDSQMEELRI